MCGWKKGKEKENLINKQSPCNLSAYMYTLFQALQCQEYKDE